MPKKDFAELSYEHHEKHYADYDDSEAKKRRARSWQRTDTVDAWCRQRLIGAIDPILESFPASKWLTVGDGRYGSDGHYIEQHGADVLATDISDTLISQAIKEGYIRKGQRENAEELSFNQEEFDFVLCKDSLHHFPRPYLAVYEMLRVARLGIVLIEPNDEFIVAGFLEHVYKFIKDAFFALILKRKKSRYQYEEVGNFIYGISEREVEKLAAALNYSTVAFKGINNYYINGIEDEELSLRGPLFRKVSFMIWWRDLLSVLKLKPAGVLAVVIFKDHIPNSASEKLKVADYRVHGLPGNPYLQS